MTSTEKLITDFLAHVKDFTFVELEYISRSIDVELYGRDEFLNAFPDEDNYDF